MKTIQQFATCLLLITLAGCNISSQAAVPTPFPVESPTQAPTTAAIAVPLYLQVTMTSSTSSEEGKAPNYTLITETPVLQGSSDPRILKFNTNVAALVQQEVDQFHKNLSIQPATPITGGSFFELRFKLISPTGNILSLQFQIDGMADGAAHPYHFAFSYNYDLENGQEISFDQLFLPGVKALQPIADYCKAELIKRDIGFKDIFAAGADPTAENYAVWNLSTEGLVIVFNEYQVASYAAGPQTVVVPFEILQSILDPSGPFADLKNND